MATKDKVSERLKKRYENELALQDAARERAKKSYERERAAQPKMLRENAQKNATKEH